MYPPIRLNFSAANSAANSLSDRFEMLAEIDCLHFTGTIQISLTSRVRRSFFPQARARAT
jgi:hypothetical protein